jgi:tetratricopeptide (TPR) repeat protein
MNLHGNINPDGLQINSQIPWRTFSIFISSTFADMQAERDYLKQRIFPKIEEDLLEHRIHLEFVDLRWGVNVDSISQENEREANVLKVCYEEIVRCQPFFIGLLGDRYGWVPPVEKIKATFENVPHIKPEEGKSATELEIEFGVLASQELLVRSVFYFRDPLPYEKLPINKAGWYCDEYDPNISEIEKLSRKSALEKLKINIRQYFDKKELFDKVKSYCATWDETISNVTGLEDWGNQVYKDILAECVTHAEKTQNKVPLNWKEQELAMLDVFVETHTQSFCGRKILLHKIMKHLVYDDTTDWGLVLTGESGSGKSAVFAKIFKMIKNDGFFLLGHSAGLSPKAGKVTNLLQIWIKQLSDELGLLDKSYSAEGNLSEYKTTYSTETKKAENTVIENQQKLFEELLNSLAAKKKVILLIDALDRFEPTARAQYLSWLPTMMPKNVRMFCTAISGFEKNAVTYHKGLFTHHINVFSQPEAKEMLLTLCLKQHKSLPAKVESILLEKKREDGELASSSPLWLSLAVNIFLSLDRDDFEEISKLEGLGFQKIEAYFTQMANEFDPLPGPLFIYLVKKAGDIFGKVFTDTVFNYIALSRNGLREKDIEELFHNKQWDPLQFASIRRWFKTLLVLTGENKQWNLAHIILKNAITNKLDSGKVIHLHYSIAGHLRQLPKTDSLQISETMYHMMKADNKTMAADWYGNFKWNDPHTEGSSKIMAEAIISEDHEDKNQWVDWIISLPEFVEIGKKDPLLFHENLLSSLSQKHFLNDVKIGTQLRLIQSTQVRLKKIYLQKDYQEDITHLLFVAHKNLGDLFIESGNLEFAQNHYYSSLDLIKELRKHASESSVFCRDEAISHSNIGNLLVKMGNPEKAMIHYQNSLSIRKDLFAIDFRSLENIENLSSSYEQLGDLYFSSGNLQRALDHYQASLKYRKILYEKDANSLKFVKNISLSYERMGNIYLELGEVNQALEQYLLSKEKREYLIKIMPDSLTYTQDNIISDFKTGDTLMIKGLPNQALPYYQNALKMSKDLCLRVPDSAEFSRMISFSFNRLGDLYLALNDTQKVLEYFTASVSVLEKLRKQAPDSAVYASDLAVAYDRLGDLCFSLKDNDKAFTYFQESLRIREELFNQAPDLADFAHDLSIAYDRIGDCYLDEFEIQKASEKYHDALKVREKLIKKSPDSANFMFGMLVSYEKLGNLNFARGDPPKAENYFLDSFNIALKLHHDFPYSAKYARSMILSCIKLVNFYFGQNEESEYEKYLQLCKETLQNMKRQGMYIDETLTDLLNKIARN